MRRLIGTATLFGLVLITGCGGQPTLDASSDASLQSSMQKIEASLDGPKQKQFHRAISVLILKLGFTPAADEAKFKHDTFDGKNADQIIAAGQAAEAALPPEEKSMIDRITK